VNYEINPDSDLFELGEMNAWSLKRFHFEPDLRRTTTFALTSTDELLDIAPSLVKQGPSVKCLPFKQVDFGSNSVSPASCQPLKVVDMKLSPLQSQSWACGSPAPTWRQNFRPGGIYPDQLDEEIVIVREELRLILADPGERTNWIFPRHRGL
jgi:hypothetical protein